MRETFNFPRNWTQRPATITIDNRMVTLGDGADWYGERGTFYLDPRVPTTVAIEVAGKLAQRETLAADAFASLDAFFSADRHGTNLDAWRDRNWIYA